MISCAHLGAFIERFMISEKNNTALCELIVPNVLVLVVAVSSTNITPLVCELPTLAPQNFVESRMLLSLPVELPQRQVLRTAPCFTIAGHENSSDIPNGVRIEMLHSSFIL